jgi:predicted nucleic acid-binding protein
MLNQFTVLLDSCVLYNAPIRDLLLQLASQGLFRAKWTTRIQEEFMRNLLDKRPDLKRSQLERTCELMNKSILNSLVEDYEELAARLNLPDPDDAHVLAAALKSHSQIIVTFNLKDFPEKILEKYQIEALHPDTFLRSQLDLNPPIFLSCVKAVRARLLKPPKTAQEYLFTLFQHIPLTVNALKPYSDLI